MSELVRVSAPAKINLYLDIVGKREDGYHLLNTAMQKVGLYDELELTAADDGDVSLLCLNSDLPTNEENIVVKAATLFFREFAENLPGNNCGVRISLHKNIPIAAGLGGGSSDAAATLLGLATLFGIKFDLKQLVEMGRALGADVPFFLDSSPALWAEGIGDLFSPVQGLDGAFVVLVNPGVAVSTKWAYDNFSLTKDFNNIKKENFFSVLRDRGFSAFIKESSGLLFNSLESAVIPRYMEIAEVKRDLLDFGADNSLMSGSGATVFSLFSSDSVEQARDCYKSMREKHRQVYLLTSL